MKQMRLLTFFILCSTLLLSGCWDTKDINHRALPVVMGISIDENDEYHVLFSIPIAITGDRRLVQVVEEKAPTLTRAIDTLRVNMENSLDLLHLELIIFDMKTAQKGIADEIEAIIQMDEFSSTPTVAICDEDISDFFFNTKDSFEQSGNPLFNFFEKNSGWTSYQPLSRVWEVYQSIHSHTRDVTLPVVQSSTNTTIEYLGGVALKQGDVALQLEPPEVLIYNFVTNQSQRNARVEIDKKTAVFPQKVKPTFTAEVINGRPVYHLNIEFIIVVEESEDHLSEVEIIGRFNDLMERRLLNLFVKLQQEHADVLEVGQKFRAKYTYHELEHWRDELYPMTDISVSVQTQIRNRGKIK
ncbi:Ger(x)C family spore germination protein [Cytobacillus purgationiresistens]|uniref:Ger(X)C family germination protein n=1 Tax=Cytobacillus purgationiresistens TaxID=863449 RepID=A0ABU0AN77_9BACI|nr:Ger(x)C family spore germination protein [Cytobacillus purgationiresistens]MDQ0271848.1 Ger(x)C family germination protein [Cytobacillus purgationiresistens]